MTRLADVALWDGTADRGTVSIEWDGDRITAVEPSDGAAAYSVIPGLVDTHVHLDTNVLTGDGPGSAWPLVTPEGEQSLHVVEHTRRFAEFGVTTLRDLCASPIQMSVGRALEQGVVHGGRLLASGPVGMTGGHGDLFTPPRFRGERPPVADSPDACRALVRRWAREGSTGIKIYTSGGVLSMGDRVEWRNHTTAEVAATIDEAHALGMLVAAHSHTAEGIRIALGEGADSIEHADGITSEVIPDLVAAGATVAPTLTVHEGVLAHARPEARDKALALEADRSAVYAEAAAAGVRFVLGTDANGVLVPHGGQLKELRRMRDVFRWTDERALVAGTSAAAAAVGLGSRVGIVAPGFGADLVVVRGRPWERLEDLSAESIVAVIARGRVLSGALPQ
jgi:imidazolonepropionase-like amidohydrolase